MPGETPRPEGTMTKEEYLANPTISRAPRDRVERANPVAAIINYNGSFGEDEPTDETNEFHRADKIPSIPGKPTHEHELN